MEALKCCSKCRNFRVLSDFYRNRSKAGGRHSSCKTCAQRKDVLAYSACRRRAHKDKVLRWFKAYKDTLSCGRCGETDSVCIDFHHRNPATKLYTISEMAYAGWSIESVQSEMSKCEVLCANCHRKVEAAKLVSQSAL